MALKVDSSFELAFRRAVFSLLLVLAHLLVASLLLSLLGQLEWAKRAAQAARQPQALRRSHRVDFERRELLNTLWAESVAARSESDWSLVANTKLDAYERLLASESDDDAPGGCAASVTDPQQNPWTFPAALRTAFMAITTMGGGVLTEAAPARLGPFTKAFAALFALGGIPLALIHIGHCVKALNALIAANFRSRNTMGAFAVFGGVVLISAVAVDIALVEDEEAEQQSSFADSLYAVLLAAGAVSGHSLRRVPLPLLIPLSLALLTASGALLGALQRLIERCIAPHEFAFANGLCGRIERAVSEADLSEEEEEADEDDAETDKDRLENNHFPTRVVKFGFGPDDANDAADPTRKNAAASLLLMPPASGRNIVGDTIREESEEQSSNVADDEDEAEADAE